MKSVLSAALLFASLNTYANFCTDLKNQKTCVTAHQIADHLAVDPVYFTEGSFKDQMVDQSVKRPVQFIPELETAESYFVSQFYNQGQFWIAEVQKENVNDVIFQLALFKGPAGLTLAHGQYRFIVNNPIKLFRIKDGHIKTTETKDFIFTIQAALPKGESYNAKDAIFGNYKIVSRLSNTFDRAQLEEVKDGDVVTQHQLFGLTQNQKDQLLKNAVKFSDENLLSKNYVATTENCISIAFDILDETLASNKDRVILTIDNFFFNGKSPNEKMALDQLAARGLINQFSHLENYKR
jgi:hypothetical protein